MPGSEQAHAKGTGGGLAARDLVFGHRGVAVGRAAALELPAGTVTALLGPNGGGKTTLMRTLLGLIRPIAGEVTLSGQPLGALGRRRIAARVAYVPQQAAPVFAFPVAALVTMGRTARLGPFAAPTAADRDAALAALGALGISHLAARSVRDISGGERQLVLIARALAQGSASLVMDEPTASLDFGNQLRVLDAVAALARAEGRAVLFATHDPSQALAVADRVVLLLRGPDGGAHLTAAAPPRAAITAAALRDLYGVAVSIETLADGRTICVPAAAPSACRRPHRGRADTTARLF